MPAVTERNSTSTRATIGHQLDGLNWRPAHTGISLALGVGWMLDAFEVNIIGNVLGILQKLWNITAEQASLMVSVWLVGIMLGAVLFGYLADRFGRRKLFLITLVLYSSFTVLSALSPGYTAFLIFRFLTAIGVGAEYSAINAAVGELIPARYRGRASATVMNFWPLGSILAGFVTLYFINLLPPTIGWRFAFALGAVMALFTIWARKSLPESPRWLAARGEYRQAASIAAQVGGGMRAIDSPSHATISARAPGLFRQLWSLMRRYPGRLASDARSILPKRLDITASSPSSRSSLFPTSAFEIRMSLGSSSSAMWARPSAGFLRPSRSTPQDARRP